MAQKYRMNHDEKLARQTREAVDMAFRYHGTPSGSITSDEFLGGLGPQRGTELCMAVELMFSLSWLHRLFGDNDYADLTEQAAFNALPGGISPDWWTHQYVTQSNQPWIKRLDGRPFYDVSPYGNIFGVEPDYVCKALHFSRCDQVYMPEIYWLTFRDNVAVLLGKSSPRPPKAGLLCLCS